MSKRASALLIFAALLMLPLALGVARGAPPTPEPGFLQQGQVIKKACTPTNDYESKLYHAYGSDCVRLSFAFGPILAKPGQNDALIQPVTIEKPWYPGGNVAIVFSSPAAKNGPLPYCGLRLSHVAWCKWTTEMSGAVPV